MDYSDTYPDHMAAIDSTAVKTAAEKYVNVGHMQWVAMGDAVQIKDGLKKYGPITVLKAPAKEE